MSKITLAFGSLIVGLVLGSMLFGNHTVTFAQSSMSGIKIDCNGMPGCVPMAIPGRAPQIPGLGSPVKDMGFANGTQSLDGLDCTDCLFENTKLVYSGGAVKLIRPHFDGKIEVELTGAAGNTMALLPLLTAVAQGQQPEPPNPNRPVLKTISVKKPIVLAEWNAPFK